MLWRVILDKSQYYTLISLSLGRSYVESIPPISVYVFLYRKLSIIICSKADRSLVSKVTLMFFDRLTNLLPNEPIHYHAVTRQ